MNTKFTQLFKEFSWLDHEEKKKKVLAMLDYIKDKMDMATAIGAFIQNSPDISDDFLARNYTMIMQTALDSNEQKMTQEAQQRLEQIASIQKAQSEESKKDEEEADNLLTSI